MTETMLALVALMITVFFTMSQQRAIVQAEQEIASIELEVMANAVGSEMMQIIAGSEYDLATTGVDLQSVTLGSLTPVNEFGEALDCPSVCDDIDDFNNMQPSTMTYRMGEDSVGTAIEFAFSISAIVNYVDDAGAISSTPTWTKEVTLHIDQEVGAGEQKYLLYPITLKRQFSPQ